MSAFSRGYLKPHLYFCGGLWICYYRGVQFRDSSMHAAYAPMKVVYESK
jgi:hypothetical protein